MVSISRVSLLLCRVKESIPPMLSAAELVHSLLDSQLSLSAELIYECDTYHPPFDNMDCKREIWSISHNAISPSHSGDKCCRQFAQLMQSFSGDGAGSSQMNAQHDVVCQIGNCFSDKSSRKSVYCQGNHYPKGHLYPQYQQLNLSPESEKDQHQNKMKNQGGQVLVQFKQPNARNLLKKYLTQLVFFPINGGVCFHSFGNLLQFKASGTQTTE